MQREGVGNDGHVSTFLPIANAEGGNKGGSLIGARCKSPCHSSSSSLMRLEAKGMLEHRALELQENMTQTCF